MAVVDGKTPVEEQETLIVTNPVTGDVVGEVPVTSPDQVKEAVDRARRAAPSWAALSVKERARMVRRWGDLLWEDRETVIQMMRQETGKPEIGVMVEVVALDGIIQYYAVNAPRILRPKNRIPVFPIIQRARVHYKPHGVVGVISPWNYPLGLPFIDVIPALIAGNAVVIKPSEVTPLIAQHGVHLMHKAGIPADVVQTVFGSGPTGSALVKHVDYIHFTGSTETGRKVAVSAADRLIPYSLELGGKDSALVLNDANVDMTAAALLAGSLENAGQMCISVERAYVEAGIYDRLIDRIQYYADQLVVGPADGLDVHVGSMTNLRELERTEAHIKDAVDKGATILFGGRRRPDLGPLFHEPTILTNVDHTMDIMRDETFGPVLPIMKVRDANEAVNLANDTTYGLSSSIFSRDLKRAEQIALRLDTGDVNVNCTQFATGTPSIPTGGQRNSGIGRRNGPEGLLKYTASQSILMDTLLGQQPELVLLGPRTLLALLIMRVLRRIFPFF